MRISSFQIPLNFALVLPVSCIKIIDCTKILTMKVIFLHLFNKSLKLFFVNFIIKTFFAYSWYLLFVNIHAIYTRKRKTLEQKRLFQGYCDLIISKLFSPDTPHYYRNISASH